MIKKASYSREYRCWAAMLDRCTNLNTPDYKYYGARGITVCDQWKTFKGFYLDMGDKPSPEHTLERRNNDLGYYPDNCYWATRSEQARNRRNTIIATFHGETKPVIEWAANLGIPYTTLRRRIIQYGPQEAFTRPRYTQPKRSPEA